MSNNRIFKEQTAEKFSPTKDFFDVSAVWGTWPALKIVKWIYNTPITPPQVTAVALVFGISAACFLAKEGYWSLFLSALLIQLKNILDTVDGNLARARNTPSRIGRFLDSIADFITNFALFIAIGWNLRNQYSNAGIWVLSGTAFLCSVLQCSYYVFYSISYLKIKDRLTASRVDESIQKDEYADFNNTGETKLLIILHKLFLFFYAWQDRFVMKIDQWSLKPFDNCPSNWYLNRKLLTMTSWLGLGMQLFFFTVFALSNKLYLYLWFVIVAGNIYWLFLVYYRINFFRYKK